MARLGDLAVREHEGVPARWLTPSSSHIAQLLDFPAGNGCFGLTSFAIGFPS